MIVTSNADYTGVSDLPRDNKPSRLLRPSLPSDALLELSRACIESFVELWYRGLDDDAIECFGSLSTEVRIDWLSAYSREGGRCY